MPNTTVIFSKKDKEVAVQNESDPSKFILYNIRMSDNSIIIDRSQESVIEVGSPEWEKFKDCHTESVEKDKLTYGLLEDMASGIFSATERFV